MDEESDNPEDARELESRLYSQVFHGIPVDQENVRESLVLNDITITSTVPNHKNASFQKKRYWSRAENKSRNVKRITAKIYPNIGRKANSKNNLSSESKTKEFTQIEKTFLKPYEPYEPLIFNPQSQEISIENVQNKAQKDKSSQKGNALIKKKKLLVEPHTNSNIKKLHNRFNQKSLENRNKSRSEIKRNSIITKSYKNINNKHKMTIANQAKQKKLESIIRIKEKKAKSKNIRDNMKKLEPKEKLVEIILIDDTDNDDDQDVICIPTPAPPLIALDESEDESKENNNINETSQEDRFTKKNNNSKVNNSVFSKPKIKKSSSAPVSAIQSNDSSRCTSPCSIFSTDDFISQGEKSRLLEVSVVDDDDLIFTETVDSFISRKSKSSVANHQLTKIKSSNMPPPSALRTGTLQRNDKKKTKTGSKTNYLVKDNSFRAVDVYDESESDFSVYSKGSISNKRQTDNNVEKPFPIFSSSSSSSSSESAQTDIIQKVKRLRKRRASSNKGSDKKNSESESENEINKNSTGLPYITKGEAVEKVKKRRRASEPNLNATVVENNSSDIEFISKLNKIVHEKNTEKMMFSSKSISTINNESDISDEAEESITARKIAEDVINKSQQNRCAKNKEDTGDLQSLNESVSPRLDTEKEPAVTLIQTDIPYLEKETIITEQQLKEAFEEVDKMELKSELCREVSPEMTFLDITQSDIEDEEIENEEEEIVPEEPALDYSEIEVGGVTYYSIDSHTTDNIGWCEEMYRFYNMSWGGEKFTVKGVKQTLDRKACWNIRSTDRFPKIYKKSKIKCFNCCEFGHFASKCFMPRKPLICYMCGEEGHREPRCPNTICLKCGSKTEAFTRGCVKCNSQNNQTCFICKLRGHTFNLCPDKWRRYHSTVTPNSDLNNRVKYNNIKHCCVCAGRGHLPEQCKYAKLCLEQPPPSSQIKSHVKLVESQPNSTILSNSTITYNLLFEPNNNIYFSFSVNKLYKPNGYYDRFMKAVKLNHLVYNPFSNQELSKKSKKKSLNSQNIRNDKEDPEEVQKKILKNSQNKAIEHQFKSPNVVAEKSNSVNEKNKASEQELVEKGATIGARKDFTFDSDSNYSFSDHFDVPKSTPVKAKQAQEVLLDYTEKTKELDLSKPQRISRPMEDLPEFIPLSSSNARETEYGRIENNENNEGLSRIPFNESQDSSEERDNQITPSERVLGISHKLRNTNLSESDFDESVFSDIPSIGKIFLPKNFSDYLLSPDGNKFLVENSNKYNIKASIDWTSVGNVLVLEGFKEDQNSFHVKLMLELRSLPKKLHNDVLEKSLRVPKKRPVLMKFLQEDLQRLDYRIGNVYDLHKQLQIYEHQQSKNGLRQAQRIRTKLNMILLGQAGLRDGKMYLENLLKHLIQLKKNKIDNVDNEIRDEIDKSWKYIFSPLEHSNYDELIDNYYSMKRQNALPILKIRDIIKNGNVSFELNITNRSDKFNAINNQIELEKSRNQLKRRDQINELDQLSNMKIPKLFLNITDSNNTFSQFLIENQEKNNDDEKEKEILNKSYLSTFKKIEQLLDDIINKNISKILKNSGLSAEMPSAFWSKESSKYLTDILKKHDWNDVIKKKISIILNSATSGLLSHNDYRNMLSIKNIVSSLVNT